MKITLRGRFFVAAVKGGKKFVTKCKIHENFNILLQIEILHRIKISQIVEISYPLPFI